ncbi:MAG: response regulator [Anaerolineaceae bacterium]|nr:response regulator [Anaerolineaceae bacterium]
MAYSLIIADDEAIMRNGLSNLFKWHEIDFQVEAVFSNGREVIDYLKHHMVDCILTDIAMPFVTGLELARFVYENRLPTRVVIISGHRDFEYAQKAVEYGVEHFLLKPLVLGDLRKVFMGIRDKLDQQQEANNISILREDQYNRLANYIEQQFMVDLVLGTLRDEHAFWHKVSLLGYHHEDIDRCCLLFSLDVKDDLVAGEYAHEYGMQGLAQHLSSILHIIDPGWTFFQIKMQKRILQGLFVDNHQASAEQSANPQLCGNPVNELAETVEKNLFAMSGIQARVISIKVYRSLFELSKHQQQLEAGLIDGRATPEYREIFSHLREQKKLLVSYLQQGDEASANGLFSSFVNQCQQINYATAQNQTIHFFSQANVKLAGEDHEKQQALEAMISYVAVSQLPDSEALVRWGQEKITQLIACMKTCDHGVDHREDTVTRVKRYMQENFHRDLSLAETAESVYLNPVYLSRMFKEKTGLTFIEYLTSLRIKAAQELLADPSVYVYEVCQKVGYNNLKYFYRLFKKETGLSPSEYRDSITAQAAGLLKSSSQPPNT